MTRKFAVFLQCGAGTVEQLCDLGKNGPASLHERGLKRRGEL